MQTTYGGFNLGADLRGHKADNGDYDAITKRAEGAIKLGSFVKKGTTGDEVQLVDNGADRVVGFAPATHAFEQSDTDLEYADNAAVDVIVSGRFFVELTGDTNVSAFDTVKVDPTTGEVSAAAAATVSANAYYLKDAVVGDIVAVQIIQPALV